MSAIVAHVRKLTNRVKQLGWREAVWRVYRTREYSYLFANEVGRDKYGNMYGHPDTSTFHVNTHFRPNDTTKKIRNRACRLPSFCFHFSVSIRPHLPSSGTLGLRIHIVSCVNLMFLAYVLSSQLL
jgi:hypothetical protein